MLEKRLINYLDGLWAITDIIPRTNHKPTVRRLVVPGHERDEKRRHDLMRRREMNHFPTTTHVFHQQQVLPRRRSMPLMPHLMNQFWHY